ncbi:hypothetical protein PENSPDRAFT_704516, partial [Peniophora sp. CONT]
RLSVYIKDPFRLIDSPVDVPCRLVLVILLSLNTIMSDAIVLWRMCVVWDKKRPALAFSTLLVVSTLALNIANIVLIAITTIRHKGSFILSNNRDSEQIFAIYGSNTIGLAAAFVSLASNLCATMFVGLKAWLYRKRIAEQIRSSDRRTSAERLLELLVDSGTVYTAIWVSRSAAFRTPISSTAIGIILFQLFHAHHDLGL